VGGILLVAVFVIVGVFVGAPPAEPAGSVMRFPEVRAAHTVEEVLYLGVLALWAIHFLALYRALSARRAWRPLSSGARWASWV
jgi:hypothetical protein